MAEIEPRFGRAALADWGLDPDVTYLNHGTVGAVPLRVLEAQQALRLEIERQPSQFLLRELAELPGSTSWARRPRLRTAADAVGMFIGAHGDDLVFVDNATTGANAVLRSLHLRAGDEILVTDHGYGGVTLAAQFVAREAGAIVRQVTLPASGASDEEIVDAIGGAISAQTRVAVVDHLGSQTAQLLPIAAIADRCRSAGVRILADGAHVPGMLRLDINSLGVDWYVGNLHKWCWAPRGTGIVWARPEEQADLHPTVISWGLDKGYTTEFDWAGTRDPSGWLTAPFGIDLMKSIGVEEIRAHNHDLAWNGAALLTEKWGTRMEVGESSFGSMITVPLPQSFGAGDEVAARLRDALLYEDRIEIPVVAREGHLWVRVSAQVYNDYEDIERLGAAISARL